MMSFTKENTPSESFAIIIVDDEHELAQCLKHDLARLYPDIDESVFSIESLPSMQDALELISSLIQDGIKIPLVISDFAMPEGSGLDLFRELRHGMGLKDTRLLLISGHIEHEAISNALTEEIVDGYLVKPYQELKLKEEVKRLVSQYFIRYHPSLIPHFPKLISHDAYVRALMEVESQKQKLSSQIGLLKSNTLLPHSKSDQEVFESLTESLKKWVEKNHRQDLVSEYSPGQVILEENEINNSLWFILEGDTCQDKKGQWGQVMLSEDSRGNLFGLLSFMSLNRSFSRIYAKTPCTILRCDRKDLDHLFSDDPDVIFHFLNALLRILKKRLMSVSETKVELQNTFQSLERAQVQLIEAEKMATIGIMTAGVAHELNNPATALERGSDHLQSCMLSLLKSVDAGEIKPSGLLKTGIKLLEREARSMGPSSADIREKMKSYPQSLPRATARKRAELELAMGDIWHEWLQTEEKNKCIDPQRIDLLYNFFEISTFLQNIRASSHRMASLVKGMKNYARAETTAFEEVDVAQGLEDTYWVLQNRLKAYHFEKIYHCRDKVWGVPSQLNQIWTNLLSNACDASAPGSTIKVEIAKISQNSQNFLEVLIKDQGSGIPTDLQSKIFEPRFTTKKGQDGHFGLGLGLAIVRKIVLDHRGLIDFESTPGQGTTFRILLPLAVERT